MKTGVFHTVNEGVYLWMADTGLLIDGLHRGGECGFSTTPPEIRRRLREGSGLFSHLDGLLFTHLHTDHYDPRLAEEACAGQRPIAVYGPGLGASGPAGRPYGPGIQRLRVGGAEVYAVDTVHDGQGMEREPHWSLLVRGGGESLFFAGDARLEAGQAEALRRIGGMPAAAFVNLYQASAREGQDFLRRLSPRRVFLYHLPFPDDDPYHYRMMAGQVRRRFPGDLPELELLEQMAWTDGRAPAWEAALGPSARPGGRSEEPPCVSPAYVVYWPRGDKNTGGLVVPPRRAEAGPVPAAVSNPPSHGSSVLRQQRRMGGKPHMEQGYARITVCFEEPFWVCLFEREWDGRLEACKITFGAEPRDYEVYAWLLEHWRGLAFSLPVEAGSRDRRPNAKRLRREAEAALRRTGTGTKAQQALQLQREQCKQTRREDRRTRDEAEEERKFQLRQEKKKAKHRGR